MIQKYPFNDNLINVRVLNIRNRCQHKLKEIVYFVNRFKIVEDAALDKLEGEFIRYQTDADVANIDTDDAEMNARIDVKWPKISLLKQLTLIVQRSCCVLRYNFCAICSLGQNVTILNTSNPGFPLICSLL